MSHIAVTRVHNEQDEAPSFLEDLKALKDKIRDRAFAIFEERGSNDRDALDDWLRAERNLTYATESDLTEKDSGFRLQLAVPGFDENDVNVTALPGAIVVSAQSRHHHQEDDGDVHFCEFGEKQLFRRFDLPKAIDVDKVSAQLDKGILRVTAKKAQPKELTATAA